MPAPRWLARFNLQVTNHLLGPLARRLPGWGVVLHIGRKTIVSTAHLCSPCAVAAGSSSLLHMDANRGGSTMFSRKAAVSLKCRNAFCGSRVPDSSTMNTVELCPRLFGWFLKSSEADKRCRLSILSLGRLVDNERASTILAMKRYLGLAHSARR